MVVVVFRARVKENKLAEYYARVAELEQIAESMPGYVSNKAYTSDDGERVSIHEWESAEALEAWRTHPEHVKMQALGRAQFYDEYTLYVCNEPRESRFTAEEH